MCEPKLVTKEDMDKYVEISERLKVVAYEVLEEMAKIDRIAGCETLMVTNLVDTNDDVCFEGEETWSLGGREEYYFCFPASLLWDEEARSNAFKRRKEVVELRRDNALRVKKKQEEADSRRVFERLKLRFRRPSEAERVEYEALKKVFEPEEEG